jgi:hypothetical protein
MSYQAQFKGWKKLALEDLLVAYRKAKADQFFENSYPTALNFAKYEQNLLENLNRLLEELQSDNGFKDNARLLGYCRLLPKNIGIDPKPGQLNGHAHFSDQNRGFEAILQFNTIKPEFRVVGDFPVDTHVLSALWINMVGHKFDACLDESCYGARLRRVRNDEVIDKLAPRPFHITAIGSFAPYYQPYQKWRSDGLQAIRDELERGKKVVAASLDLRSYYHLLDPESISQDGFLDDLDLLEEGDAGVNESEREFTLQMSRFLGRWSRRAKKFADDLQSCSPVSVNGGLVIGLTASRVISNVILHKWDSLIREKVAPIHYGRYVDDMFLVLRDPGTIKCAESFMEFLQERLGSKVLAKVSEGSSGVWKIQLGHKYQKRSTLELQAGKQKLFILAGQAGCDLLDSIEKEIVDLSSEHRLMPSPDQLEHSTAARVLSAAGSVAEGADSLRRADGLTIRRLSWALQLRHVETLARDLPAKAWTKERAAFYQFAHNHVLRPEKIFAHYVHLPRLLGFAIRMGEWEEADAIVRRTLQCVEQLEGAVEEGGSIAINGVDCSAGPSLWSELRGSLAWMFMDAAAASYDPDRLFSNKPHAKESKLAKLFLDQLIHILTFEEWLEIEFGLDAFFEQAPLVALADLSREPYKKLLRSKSALPLIRRRKPKNERALLKAMAKTQLVDVDALQEFLKRSSNIRLSGIPAGKRKAENVFLPYLFPTRPYTAAEIAELVPACVGFGVIEDISPGQLWARCVRAVRGVWVKPALLAAQEDGEERVDKPKKVRRRLKIGDGGESQSVLVAIANVKTTESTWAASVRGKPELTYERYHRLSDLVNGVLRAKPRPDYFVLPECSLPVEWVDSIANRLLNARISLIAGTEYHQRRHSIRFKKNEIRSSVFLGLTDGRLGYPSSVRIWQPKAQPAPGEEQELTETFGKAWRGPDKQLKPWKPVYRHNDFHFGILVCSELQNTRARVRFQGEVDALIVLSWNQDLETFSSLVESAALDIHAYTVLVNNRLYGDSRVRSPAKERYNRDRARVRGGENDYFVVVKLDVDGLRIFQRRAKRWPRKADPFKPVPEGFDMSPSRRKLPRR